MIVEHDGRWQLHQLHPERDHVVVVDEPLGVGPVTSRCDRHASGVALDLIDPSTNERVRVTECDVPFTRERWAPDGSMLAVQETCGEEQTRVRIVDHRGVELGHSPCGALSLGPWSPDSDVVAVGWDEHTHALQPDGHMVDLGPGSPGAWRPGPLRE